MALLALFGASGHQYTVGKVDASGNAVTLAGTSWHIDGPIINSLSAQWQGAQVGLSGLDRFVV